MSSSPPLPLPAVTPSLLAELQAAGVVAEAPAAGVGRRGGAGPSDHRALTLGASTVMVPMRDGSGGRTPFRLRVVPASDAPAAGQPAQALLLRGDETLAAVELPAPPRFYALTTADGVPFWKIALLHSRRVLASTVLQSCVRYADPARACQFCAIGTSLREGRTLARKSPAQLAEVTAAAVRLDGVEQVVLTTGTPASADRGAAHLGACAAAIKQAVPGLPVQVQCEPPEDFAWFARLRAAGADTLGLHLEVVDPVVRAAVIPGKAEIPVPRYFEAFAAAVAVFGRGQVSSYLIAGLGDDPASLVDAARRMLELGVYPFVVPFVPIAGTPLADRRPPDAATMLAIYERVGRLTAAHGLRGADMKAGCGKCGACSTVGVHEACA
jgi:radical SAM protein (TIGR04043 family)